MSAFKHALKLREDDSESRLALALSLLQDGDSPVLFEDEIALWREEDRVVAAVIDPYSDGPDSADRYRELIKSAQKRFDHSSLRQFLPATHFDWIVLNDYGMGTIKLWPK